MAYTKKYRGRKKARRTFKKKGGWMKKAGTAYNVASTAYTALKTAKFVADLVNAEYKDRELILNDTASNNVGTVYSLLPSIPQGTAVHERIGDSIKLQRMTIRFTLTRNSAAIAQTYRMILFRGKNEGGVAYTPGMILQYQDILSPKTEDTKFNTKFLIDKTYTLDSAKANILTRTWNVPLNWHCNFQTGSPVNIKDGGLYLMCLQSGTNNSPSNHMIYKITYTDN